MPCASQVSLLVFMPILAAQRYVKRRQVWTAEVTCVGQREKGLFLAKHTVAIKVKPAPLRTILPLHTPVSIQPIATKKYPKNPQYFILAIRHQMTVNPYDTIFHHIVYQISKCLHIFWASSSSPPPSPPQPQTTTSSPKPPPPDRC